MQPEPDVDEQEDPDHRRLERDDLRSAEFAERVAVEQVRQRDRADSPEGRPERVDFRAAEGPPQRRDDEVRDADEGPEADRARDNSFRRPEQELARDDLVPPLSEIREEILIQVEDDAEDEEEEREAEEADEVRRPLAPHRRRDRADRRSWRDDRRRHGGPHVLRRQARERRTAVQAEARFVAVVRAASRTPLGHQSTAVRLSTES